MHAHRPLRRIAGSTTTEATKRAVTVEKKRNADRLKAEEKKGAEKKPDAGGDGGRSQ